MTSKADSAPMDIVDDTPVVGDANMTNNIPAELEKTLCGKP